MKRLLCGLIALGALALPLPTLAAPEAASWRADALRIEESAVDAEGWQTIACEGEGCAGLFDALTAQIAPADLRRGATGLQVRAAKWHEELVGHFGPFRAAEPIGALRLPHSPWLDARYSALACNWQVADATHQLSMQGGSAARYTSADGASHPVRLRAVRACQRCRAHYLELDWAVDAKPEPVPLRLRWSGVDFLQASPGVIGGFAYQSDAQPARMRCALQPAVAP